MYNQTHAVQDKSGTQNNLDVLGYLGLKRDKIIKADLPVSKDCQPVACPLPLSI